MNNLKQLSQEITYTPKRAEEIYILTSFFISAANTTPVISTMMTKITMIAYFTELKKLSNSNTRTKLERMHATHNTKYCLKDIS